MVSEPQPVHVVVLAGGRSRRFGADKLDARLDDATVLDRVVSSLPGDWDVLVVGPHRPLHRAVTFVDEEPPGSGPGAALVAGARAVAARRSAAPPGSSPLLVSLPGDAPSGGAAAVLLVDALLSEPAEDGSSAVIGVDPEGQFQPLQVAVRGPSLAALAAHDPETVVGASARRLVMALDPRPLFLPGRLTHDIDTPEDLTTWLRDD